MAPLPNPLASRAQLEETPSREDGIPADLEEELRVYGCQLIQQAGILLYLPQVAMATAQVLFQRFWFVSSMKNYGIKDISIGALFLATKLEEQRLRVRDLINVFDYLIKRDLHTSKSNLGPRALELAGLVQIGDVRQMASRLQSSILDADQKKNGSKQKQRADAPNQGLEHSSPFTYTPTAYFAQEFYDAKDTLVVAEMQILKRLGFNVQVNLPYATMVNYLKLLGLTDGQAGSASDRDGGEVAQKSFAQRAWSYLNDALQTTLYCQFPPHVLACAVIYLTALTNRPSPLALPVRPQPWWALFDAEEEDLRIVSATILRLYDESGWSSIYDEATTPPSLGSMGLASRVRSEWGGLVDLVERKGLRNWMERSTDHAHSKLEAA